MKQGWEIKKLGNLAKVIYGYTEKASFVEIGPKFLRITDIQDDCVNWDTVPFCKINTSDFEKYKLNDGDIVFARTGATTGKSYLVKSPPSSVFASYLIKVHIQNKNLIPEYLYLFFQTKKYWDEIRLGVAGAAQGGFNATKLADVEIPLPPLPEQQSIVAILDEAFAAIAIAKANAQQNLKNSKELFESYLQGVFENKGEGWEEKMLGQIIKLEYGKPLDDGLRNQKGLYPIYGANGIKGRTNKFYHNRKTIIIGRKGSAGEINLSEEKFWPLDVTYFVTFDDKENELMFLFYLLSKLQLTKLARGVKPGINRNEVYEISVYMPLKTEQQTIIKKLDALSAKTKKLETIYQQKINDLEELKKSVLQKAFTGELSSPERASSANDGQSPSKKQTLQKSPEWA